MLKKIIQKNKINSLIKALNQDDKVLIPIKSGNSYRFGTFDNINSEFLEGSYQNTKIPPKEILFPQNEVLFKFKKDKNGIKITEKQEEIKKQIIFGIRSCDARSFNLLDNFFSFGEFKDNYYLNRRKNSILIGLACNNPITTCFCTSLGGSPFSKDNLDILITDLEDKYLIEILTERGKELKNFFEEFNDSSENDLILQKELSKKAEEAIKTNLNLEDIPDKLNGLFEHKIWDDIAKTCLSCGICVQKCPTCHCFDVHDEMEGNKGKRVRIWDTCQRKIFTSEASGHNPRDLKMKRTRQRIYHKFNFYPKNYDLIGCVGCGRCILSCPSNHDIRETLQKIKTL